nr:hypothetical protein [uncultured Hyphomonas sp.]
MPTQSDSEKLRALASQLLCRVALLVDGIGISGASRSDRKNLLWSSLPDIRLDGQLVDNMFMSPWDDACAILHETGIMIPCEGDTGQNGAFPCYFRYVRDLGNIPETPWLSQLSSADEPLFARLLTVFMTIATDYGNGLPTTPRPFTCPDHWINDMMLMVENGYALHMEDLFIWSQKISPIMQDAYIWSAERESHKEVLAAQKHTRAIEVWSSAPSRIMDFVFSEPKPRRTAAMTAMIFAYWDEEAATWSDLKLMRTRFSLARHFAKIIESNGLLD